MRLLTAAFAVTVPLLAVELTNPTSVVAHEWGTFTSVAGADGDPVRWNPLGGPPELPCFVQRGPVSKELAGGLVRMETPVLYFYSARPATVSVKVGFPLGRITEWYPNASRVPGNGMEYDSVELTPGPDPAYPGAKGESRYFAARNTDATPLKTGGQVEKMIFYRGVGDLPVPLRPKFDAAGKLQIRNVSQDPIPVAILFENRDGKLGFQVLRDLGQEATVNPPHLTQSTASVRDAVYKSLLESGLYGKEAQATLDTWQDTWFEEGMRLIYIVPRKQVDALLPLNIQPRPAETKRAFVGRIEIFSPATEQELRTALTQGDATALRKFGRFLQAFAARIGGSSSSPAYATAVKALQPQTESCVR